MKSFLSRSRGKSSTWQKEQSVLQIRRVRTVATVIVESFEREGWKERKRTFVCREVGKRYFHSELGNPMMRGVCLAEALLKRKDSLVSRGNFARRNEKLKESFVLLSNFFRYMFTCFVKDNFRGSSRLLGYFPYTGRLKNVHKKEIYETHLDIYTSETQIYSLSLRKLNLSYNSQFLI